MTNIKIATHDGLFHCTEVTACALLKLLPEYQDAEIVRTSNQAILDQCQIVVDVGQVFNPATHRYDPRDKAFNSISSSIQGKRSRTKLSVAAIIYTYFGKKILKSLLSTEDEELVELVFDKLYDHFIEEIDAYANKPRFQLSTQLSNRVEFFHPKWNDAIQDYNPGFLKAMDLVRSEFLERVTYYSGVWWPARSVVAKAIKTRFDVHKSGKIIVFENGGCPYREHLFDLEEKLGLVNEILFLVSTDPFGVWLVIAIQIRGEKLQSRLNLHPDWRGLRDQQLCDVSGIEGCLFVASAGYLGKNKTMEGAIEMAVKSIEASKEWQDSQSDNYAFTKERRSLKIYPFRADGNLSEQFEIMLRDEFKITGKMISILSPTITAVEPDDAQDYNRRSRGSRDLDLVTGLVEFRSKANLKYVMSHVHQISSSSIRVKIVVPDSLKEMYNLLCYNSYRLRSKNPGMRTMIDFDDDDKDLCLYVKVGEEEWKKYEGRLEQKPSSQGYWRRTSEAD